MPDEIREKNNEKVRKLREEIATISAIRKKRSFSSSRLNKHLHEILLMRLDPTINASYQDIASWLRKHKRIKVNKTSVYRFINKHLDSIDNQIFNDFRSDTE